MSAPAVPGVGGAITKGRSGRLLADSNWRRQTWWPAVEAAYYFGDDGELQLVPRHPPHSMRHTCASWLAQKGVSLYEVQHLLGHKSFSEPGSVWKPRSLSPHEPFALSFTDDRAKSSAGRTPLPDWMSASAQRVGGWTEAGRSPPVVLEHEGPRGLPDMEGATPGVAYVLHGAPSGWCRKEKYGFAMKRVHSDMIWLPPGRCCSKAPCLPGLMGRHQRGAVAR